MVIPYMALADGTQTVEIYDSNSNLLYAERDEVQAGENTVQWSMRDFSKIATDIPGLNHINGNYYYKSSDASVTEVINQNNDLIIASGTELRIEITLENEEGNGDLILEYTVTAGDVTNVTVPEANGGLIPEVDE